MANAYSTTDDVAVSTVTLTETFPVRIIGRDFTSGAFPIVRLPSLTEDADLDDDFDVAGLGAIAYWRSEQMLDELD